MEKEINENKNQPSSKVCFRVNTWNGMTYEEIMESDLQMVMLYSDILSYSTFTYQTDASPLRKQLQERFEELTKNMIKDIKYI
jgi:hypothetical protein